MAQWLLQRRTRKLQFQGSRRCVNKAGQHRNITHQRRYYCFLLRLRGECLVMVKRPACLRPTHFVGDIKCLVALGFGTERLECSFGQSGDRESRAGSSRSPSAPSPGFQAASRLVHQSAPAIRDTKPEPSHRSPMGPFEEVFISYSIHSEELKIPR